MPPSTSSGKPWKSVGYFQTFYCTEKSKEKAKSLVCQYFIKNEEDLSDCRFRFDHVAWMRMLTEIEGLTFGYESDLTEEMFANRHKIGIWYSGRREYYVSEKDYAIGIMKEGFDDEEEICEDEFFDEYDGGCWFCGSYPVGNYGLCEACEVKFERDIIRQRYWDCIKTVWGMTEESRESLRDEVIKRYGEKLELLKISNKSKNESKKHKKSRDN